MITCTLGEKKYSVDFVTGRTLREMEPAAKVYGKLVRISKDATEGKDVSDEQITVADALDTMVKWFCTLAWPSPSYPWQRWSPNSTLQA